MASSLIGRYAKTAAMSATGVIGNGPLFLFDFLLRFLRVIVLLSLWRMILTGKGEVSGMTLGSVLTYTLISEVFAEQLAARSGWEDAFWEGTLLQRFLRPLGLVSQFAAEMVGKWGIGFALCSLPLLLCASLIGVNPLPASPENGLLFAVSLALGVSVGLALDFVFGALMVYLDLGIWVMAQLRNALATMLSGAMLPLALLPWGLGNVISWLPFASMASSPLRIYTGTGNPSELLAVQLAWSVILWPLAFGMWRANRERVVSFGG